MRAAIAEAADGASVAVTIDGRLVEIDAVTGGAVLDLLKRLAHGEAVMVSSVAELVTTGQAARMLGVSRTYVCRLMDKGTLPFEYRGTHRRVRVTDLLDHLKRQQQTRRAALTRIQEISRDAGLV